MSYPNREPSPYDEGHNQSQTVPQSSLPRATSGPPASLIRQQVHALICDYGNLLSIYARRRVPANRREFILREIDFYYSDYHLFVTNFLLDELVLAQLLAIKCDLEKLARRIGVEDDEGVLASTSKSLYDGNNHYANIPRRPSSKAKHDLNKNHIGKSKSNSKSIFKKMLKFFYN